MATVAAILSKVRRELGDASNTFRDSFVGTGAAGDYDLTETRVIGVTVDAVNAVGIIRLTETTNYTIDAVSGRLFLFGIYNPLPVGTTLLINGSTSGMFTDEELTDYVGDGFLQHTSGRTVSRRMKTVEGFTSFIDFPMKLVDLPPIEDRLLVTLVVIECLWALTTDASTDIDITTADGTHIGRSTRYVQMRNQIDVLSEEYNTLCAQLNVGIHRIEMSTLRRVSRTTGRLVPIYKEREFDDYTTPQRLLPPIDERHADESGIPSPAWAGYW